MASTFITELLAGSRSRSQYARLISEYLPMYDALEQAARAVRHLSPMDSFFDSRLERTAALQADLASLGVLAGRPLSATQAYVDRLTSLATQQDAVRVLAHHYLRYLGDLSGGQVIGRLVQRHYDVADEALTTWDFSPLGKSKPYKDDYRDKLNTHLSQPQQADFIDEALHGYRMARALFDELSAVPVA